MKEAPEADKDFSTDEAYGQLSRKQILEENVSELLNDFVEFAALPRDRQSEIEKAVCNFVDICYKQGFEKGHEEGYVYGNINADND